MSLPSSPADRQKVKNAVQEIANSMIRKTAEDDNIKDILASLKEGYEINPKFARAAAVMIVKQDSTSREKAWDETMDLFNLANGSVNG